MIARPPSGTNYAAWRTDNAEWMRLSLKRLRLRLHRHALWLHRAADGSPAVAWLLADDDPGREQRFLADHPDVKAIDASIAGIEAELAGLGDRMRDALGSPALSALAELAALSAFEADVLLLAAAPGLDPAFARAYAELHDDPRRGQATLHLALTLSCDTAVERVLAADCLMSERRLRAFRLITVADNDDQPLLMRALSIDERLTDYLRGINRVDARVLSLLSGIPPAIAEVAAASGERVAALLTSEPTVWSTINLVGATDAGARDVAQHACSAVGLRLQALDLARLSTRGPDERDVLMALLGREAMLGGLALLVDASRIERGSPAAATLDELIERLPTTLVVVSAERWSTDPAVHVVPVAKPTRAEQRTLWRRALDVHPHGVNGAVEAIVQQFDFGPPAIADAVARAARAAGGEITERALWRSCREQTGGTFDELARRISPTYGWDDIVVSDDVRAQLRELSNQVEQRGRVYETWGFGTQLGRGRGITALFAGPSGTGKTMAAEILAAHLELDLYRIDLAGVVSKYIGETEKNLRRVFDAAERSGVILFFDEADALFGTRTEVRDSHDRYANVEVNYLLQRMEDYAGLAILATNRRKALDGAFLRRLRFVIDFPFPGADDRRRIWERVFPEAAALEDIGYGFLSRLELTGGNIRSIAVNAAFLAAADGAPIGMTHIVRAAAREYVKLAKPISAAEFGPYYPVARP